MIELGVEAKDKITGFKGIVIARHQYITGCDQYTLSTSIDKDGKLGDNYQFDEGRLEITGQGINKKEVEAPGRRPGGPQPSAKQMK